MGLIKMAKDVLGGYLDDALSLEYFYCNSLSSDLLMVKGEKQITKNRNKPFRDFRQCGAVHADRGPGKDRGILCRAGRVCV